MKNIFLLFIAITGFAIATTAQVVNEITISPSNPTASDTITIISDFSYQGNCAYGLVYNYTYVAGSTIIVMPTYCGYGDTSQCNSVDTFKIGPFPNGNYTLSIEYHQGSVCPISGFDATIAQLDTPLTISGTSGLSAYINQNSFINIYPNPANDHVTIDIENLETMSDCQLRITNSMGQKVFQRSINHKQFFVEGLDKYGNGVYFVEIFGGEKIYRGKIVIW